MNFARTVLTAAALVGAAGAANAQTSIVTNGSFESGTNPGQFATVNAGATDITGWTVGGSSVEYIGTYWMASDGVRSIDLAGTAPGVLSQVLNTVFGQIYSVTFDISKNPDGGSTPRLGTSTVSDVSGTPFVIQTVPLSFAAANTNANMMWQTVSYTFTAASQQTLLSFAADAGSSGTPPSFGLALDNVSVVVAAPEPATWALMILGFGIVGSALRRRRTKVRFNFA